jgi:hypothetical protein
MANKVKNIEALAVAEQVLRLASAGGVGGGKVSKNRRCRGVVKPR